MIFNKKNWFAYIKLPLYNNKFKLNTYKEKSKEIPANKDLSINREQTTNATATSAKGEVYLSYVCRDDYVTCGFWKSYGGKKSPASLQKTESYMPKLRRNIFAYLRNINGNLMHGTSNKEQ